MREGLDIPEVSLVAILDADKEGFLRSERSLVQTCGRAARNANGMVILYADKVTKSMQFTIEETGRRRTIQDQYNKQHNIRPETVKSVVKDSISKHLKAAGWHEYTKLGQDSEKVTADAAGIYHTVEDIHSEISELEKMMREAADKLAFEAAAEYRDQIKELKEVLLAC